MTDVRGLEERLVAAYAVAPPDGFAATDRRVSVLQVAECPPGTPSLQESVVATGWELTLVGDAAAWIGDVHAGVERVLAAGELRLSRERKGERSDDDVRPSIESLEVVEGSAVVLRAMLTTSGRALRPHELVAVTLPGRDPLDSVVRVLCIHQWIEQEGARQELLPAAPTPVGAGT